MNKLLLFITLISFTNAYAQKLPNMQQASLRAPANVKIDGKANEWDNKFQAYNKATDVFYSLANNNNKLYLVIQAEDEYIIKKMLAGRTIFTISKTDKKIDDNSVTVSYPVVNRKYKPVITYEEMRKAIADNARSVADSLTKLNNKRLSEKHKFIKVKGLKGLDTLISVYNTNGIEAVSNFDNKMIYTYELAIDLKLLGLDINGPARFNYNLKLDQLPAEETPGIKITYDGSGTVIGVDISNVKSFSPSYSIGTDFWGEYTLAK